MKRNSFIKLALLILSVFAIPTAFAADNGTPGTFHAELVIGKGPDHDIYWNCNDSGCHNKYSMHTYTLKYAGNEYPAYCVYPNAHAHGKNNVVCTKLERSTMPELYYIVDKHYDELMTDPVKADLVYRTAGSVYKFKLTDAGADAVLDDMSQNQKVGEAQFTTTYQQRVAQIQFTEKGFYGFTFHNNTTYVNNETDEPGSVHDAMAIIREAEEAVRNGYTGSTGGTSDSTNTGKKFTLTPVTGEKNADGSMTYVLSTVGGVTYNTVQVTATKGTIVNKSEWNGTSMTITILPDPTDCKASITICPEVQENIPEPSPTTPCPCYAPYSRKQVRNCLKWGPYHWNADGKGGWNECLDWGPYYWKVYKRCYEKIKDCKKQQELYDRLGDRVLVTLSAGYKYDNENITYNFETEHDTTLDTGIAYNNDDYEDETVQLAAEGEGSNSTSILYCSIGGDATQSYIAVVANATDCETIDVTIPCNDCYGECEPAKATNEFTDVYIKNCCEEEGGKAHGRQYALNELFCDYKENGIKVASYKEKCGTEDYEDKNSLQANTYCKQYCSDSFLYTIPGPTHSKADAYFYFRTRIDENISGPVLHQWKRCRTVIDYDKWYNDYVLNADSIPTNYNAYQLAMANYTMWVDLENSASSHTETISATSVTCTANYEWTETSTSCAEQTLADGTKYTPATCEVSKSGSVSGDSKSVAAATIHYYPADSYYSSENYLYPIIERKGDETTGKYTYSKMFLKSKGSPDDKSKYYDTSDVDGYVTAYNKAVSDAQSSAKGKVPSGKSFTGYSGCSSTSADSVRATRAEPADKKKSYYDSATTSRGAVNGLLSNINTLESNLNECGGTIMAGPNATLVKDGQVIKDRVKFDSEPEMEFSYVTAFLDDYGLEKDQELSIPFIKVGGTDGNGCATDKETTFLDEQPDISNPDFADFKAGIELFNSNYDTGKYAGSLQATIVDFQSLDSNELDKAKNYTNGSQYTTHKREYIADKKFTTDAAAHMVCKWKENGKDPEYTIYPYGVITEQDDGDLCDIYPCVTYNSNPDCEEISRATYHTVRTHLSGMYETYFTLRNINGGLFDDIVHEKGKTCSGYDGDNYNGHPVNASCYFEINSYYSTIEDCTTLYENVIGIGTIRSADGKAATALCCTTGDCYGQLLYDYKVVDPENMFVDTSHGTNYAYNWRSTSQGQAEQSEMLDSAKDDKTYSPDKLTYSYTLTPRDLRSIREYNKTRINEGGYADFNMYCEDGTYNGKNVKIRCKSRFLDAISGVNSLTSGTVTLNLNANNTDLNTVRNNRITNDKWGNE